MLEGLRLQRGQTTAPVLADPTTGAAALGSTSLVGMLLARGGRRQALLAAALAAATVVLVRVVVPFGIDTAAHAYETLRWLKSGFQLWDNYWYDGRYSFVDYSLLYYPIAALVGQLPTILATVAASAFLFARLIAGRFEVSSPWPALLFAITASTIVWLSGEYPFALGMMFGLAALLFRDHRRLPLTALAGLATLLASPLAFLFLLLSFVGLALGAGTVRRLLRFDLILGLGMCGLVAAALELGFPIGGIFHFNFWALFQVVAISLIALVASVGLRDVGSIRGLFVVMGSVAIASYVIPSPVGGNATRLMAYVGAPLVWILLARQRQAQRVPRVIAAGVAALVLAGQVAPTVVSAALALGVRSDHTSFWHGAIGFLRTHANPNFRVEAVDTADHSDAYFLPAADIPIVRGWFRQDDLPDNALLYNSTVSAGAYQAWLRVNGVRYVVLPHDALDYSAKAEAALLRSGRSGLPAVYRDSNVTIFELPSPTPLLGAPPGETGHVLDFGHDSVLVDVSGPGTYPLAISYTPYWRTSPLGRACVAKSPDGFSTLVAAQGGVIQLRFDPTLAELLRRRAGDC
jgi:hypothetical protein